MNRQLTFIVPGDINARTGGYHYDRQVIQGLREQGWQVRLESLSSRYPQPTPQDLDQAAALLQSLADDSLVLIDGLAFGVMSQIVIPERERLRLVALVHHPLALETGVSDAARVRLEHGERQALSAARRIITTSPSTTNSLHSTYAVPATQLRTVAPGTRSAPVATGSTDEKLNMLCVATLTQRKGHACLIDALATLADLPWRLTCVGSADRDPETTRRLRAQLLTLGLENKVNLAGEVGDDELQASYQSADLFVLASLHEGYGMVFDEALAAGVPIVSTTAGAIPDTVPKAAGVLVPPDDSKALADALQRLISDRSTLAALREAALIERNTRRSWRDVAQAFDLALRDVPSTAESVD